MHVFVLVHGNNGAGTDFQYFKEQLDNTLGCEALSSLRSMVLVIDESNTGRKTLNGIRVCAARMKDEIIRKLRKVKDTLPESICITFICHSLGGLIARCCFPELFNDEEFGKRFIPFSFITMSTPHLGSRRPGGTVLKGVWKTMIHFVVGSFYSQTGKELLLEEENLPLEKQLLFQLADPELDYMKQLARFKYRMVVAIPHYDLAVPYCGAVINDYNPFPVPPWRFPKFQVVGHHGFTDQYNSTIFERYGTPSTNLDGKDLSKVDTRVFCSDNVSEVEYPQVVLKNLQTLSWRRLCIQFGGIPGPHLHDMYLKKKSLGSVIWYSMEGGSTFILLLNEIIKLDLSDTEDKTLSTDIQESLLS